MGRAGFRVSHITRVPSLMIFLVEMIDMGVVSRDTTAHECTKYGRSYSYGALLKPSREANILVLLFLLFCCLEMK